LQEIPRIVVSTHQIESHFLGNGSQSLRAPIFQKFEMKLLNGGENQFDYLSPIAEANWSI
jgi:hypothetical protein